MTILRAVMDPITTAIIAGASAACKDSAQKAIKDAYAALKQAVVRWIGHQPRMHNALAKIEENPENDEACSILDDVVTEENKAGASDAEVTHLAEALAIAIQKHGTVAEQRSVGVIFKKLKTANLAIGQIQPTTEPGTGAIFEDVEAEAVSIKGIGPAKKA